MKTRQGLVSNSSTSSFVCLLPKTIHEEILNEYNELHPELFKKFINHIVEKVDKFGKNMVTFSYIRDIGGNMDMCPEDEIESCLTDTEYNTLQEDDGFQEEGVYGWLDYYENAVDLKLKKYPDLVFTASPGIG